MFEWPWITRAWRWWWAPLPSLLPPSVAPKAVATARRGSVWNLKLKFLYHKNFAVKKHPMLLEFYTLVMFIWNDGSNVTAWWCFPSWRHTFHRSMLNEYKVMLRICCGFVINNDPGPGTKPVLQAVEAAICGGVFLQMTPFMWFWVLVWRQLPELSDLCAKTLGFSILWQNSQRFNACCCQIFQLHWLPLGGLFGFL